MKKSIRFALLSASLLVAVAPAINANIPAMAEHFNHVPRNVIDITLIVFNDSSVVK